MDRKPKWEVVCRYNENVKPPRKPMAIAIQTWHMTDASMRIEVEAAEHRGDVTVEVRRFKGA